MHIGGDALCLQCRVQHASGVLRNHRLRAQHAQFIADLGHAEDTRHGMQHRLRASGFAAVHAEGAPDPLPMPLQNILVSEAHQRMNESGDPTAVAMPVGQIVGRMNEIRPVEVIIAELVAEFEAATKRLDTIRDN